MSQICIFYTDPRIPIGGFPIIILSLQGYLEQLLVAIFQTGTCKQQFGINSRHRLTEIAKSSFRESSGRHEQHIILGRFITRKQVKPETGSYPTLDTQHGIHPVTGGGQFTRRIQITVDLRHLIHAVGIELSSCFRIQLGLVGYSHPQINIRRSHHEALVSCLEHHVRTQLHQPVFTIDLVIGSQGHLRMILKFAEGYTTVCQRLLGRQAIVEIFDQAIDTHTHIAIETFAESQFRLQCTLFGTIYIFHDTILMGEIDEAQINQITDFSPLFGFDPDRSGNGLVHLIGFPISLLQNLFLWK